MQPFGCVPAIDEDHGHGPLQCRVQLNYEVKLCIFGHLHLIVLDTLQLLSLLLDTEALEVADEAPHEFEDSICVSRRIKTVLRSDVELREVLLEGQEAFVVRLLDEELISFVIDDHLQCGEV